MWKVLLYQLVILICVALAVAVWILGPKIGLVAVWLRIVIIAAIVLPPMVYLIYLIFKKIAERKAARGLEDGMKEQGLAHQQGARPDRQEDIAILNENFDDAVEALRRSKLTLYDLPWYMIIGPPAAGKSTALLNSGLRFPFTSASGGRAIRGIGGTRNCDWWFSDEAVLLDTAGRYTSEYEDQDEWLAFLKMIKRYRSRRPLNGLIVCISVEDLLKSAPEQVEQTASMIRERVDQVINTLEMIVPIYVLFSKSDLLSGFVEFFGDLKKSSRRQVFGFTVPLTDPRTDIEALFNREFNLLRDSVEGRVVRRLGSAKQPTRPGVYQFPLQFAAARAPLAAFLTRLFTYSPYQESPRLRGVYFCSGTQEGQPLNQVVAQMSQALGLGQAADDSAQEQKTKKSYFLYDVFTRVMFPDKELAGATAVGISRRLRLRVIFAVLLMMVAGTVLAAGTTSFIRNRMLVSKSQTLSKDARRTVAAKTKLDVKLASLEQLGRLIDQLHGFRDDSPPLSYRFGFYSGDALLPKLEKLYTGKFWEVAGFTIDEELLANLEDTTTQEWASTKEEAETNYNQLKIYLMVTEPKRLELELASSVLLGFWKYRLKGDLSKKTEVLQPLLERYLRLLKAGRHKWSETGRNDELVEKVRNELKRRDVDYKRLVFSLIESDTPPAMTLIMALRNKLEAKSILLSKTEVKGVYTKDGWTKYIKKRLKKVFSEKAKGYNWVMGLPEKTDPAVALRQQYFKDYSHSWTAFLKGINYIDPRDARGALRMLDILIDHDLHKAIFTTVVENTDFRPAVSGAMAGRLLNESRGRLRKAAKTAQRLGLDRKARERANALHKKNAVELVYSSLMDAVTTKKGVSESQLDQYVTQLVKVRTEYKAFLQSSERSKEKLRPALERAYSVTASFVALLKNPQLRAAVEPLLKEPLVYVSKFAGEETETDLRTKAKGLCSTIQDRLKGYPFLYRDSAADGLPANVKDVFHPIDGEIWKSPFFTTIKSNLVLSGSKYEAKRGASKITKQMLPFINKAHTVTKALFPPGAQMPGLTFQVRPSPVNIHDGDYEISEVTLEIDGQSKTYKMGPQKWWSFKWPGDSGDRGARITVRGDGFSASIKTIETEWSLLRLLDKASRVRPRGATFYVEWALENGKIVVPMIIRPSRSDNPIMLRSKITNKKKKRSLVCR